MNATGYCGLQCNECPLYIAFHTGDKALMERTAREYSTVDCVFEKEEMRCGGCQSDIVPEKMCAGCEMRNCARRRHVKACTSCNDYPCKFTDQYGVSKEKQDLSRA